MEKLRPCDCKDIATANRLNEQGINHNDDTLMIYPNSVIMTLENTTVRIPMKIFKMFSEWYLEEQEIN